MATALCVLLVEAGEVDALLLMRTLQQDGDVTYTRVQNAEQMRAGLARADWDTVIPNCVMPTFSGPQALQILEESSLIVHSVCVSVGDPSGL